MIGRLRTGTLRYLMAVMAVGVLLHAQTAAACAMPDPEPSKPCCAGHCDEAITDSHACAEPVMSAVAVGARGSDVRMDDSRGPATDHAQDAGAPPDDWVALAHRRPRPEPFTEFPTTDGAHGAVYLVTRRIRI